jgi:hypothetical protein
MNSTMLSDLILSEFFNVFIHSFLVSFLICIPFTVFMYEKYVDKKNISHFNAWFPYICILSFAVGLNINRVYSDKCDPRCLYLFSLVEFSRCCKENLVIY